MAIRDHARQAASGRGWLLLMHQLPARPAYLRVKVWRGLREAGAVAVRHSGYVLPLNEQTRIVMRQAVREIERGEGQAALCEAHFIDGISDSALRGLFNAAREADFAAVETALRKIGAAGPAGGRQGDTRIKLEKAARRLKAITDIDFFNARGRGRAESLLARLEHGFIVQPAPVPEKIAKAKSAEGKVWVTRRNIHVDRIACAWLIQRFIDPEARFKFVTDKKYAGRPGELRFDMAGAEFTHEGDNCSFETLLRRFALRDPALRAIGEIVHDLDLKDGKFGRPEASGLGHVIDGIALTQRGDLDRIGRGASLFDDLHARFKSG